MIPLGPQSPWNALVLWPKEHLPSLIFWERWSVVSLSDHLRGGLRGCIHKLKGTEVCLPSFVLLEGYFTFSLLPPNLRVPLMKEPWITLTPGFHTKIFLSNALLPPDAHSLWTFQPRVRVQIPSPRAALRSRRLHCDPAPKGSYL